MISIREKTWMISRLFEKRIRSRGCATKVSHDVTKTVDVLANTEVSSKHVKPLYDTFGRFHDYLRISLTERCNLRCLYCMPEEGVKLTPNKNLLTTDEVIYLTQLFVQEGVRKVRLTGGEPTVRRDLEEIIRRMKKIEKLKSVSITTNALVLTRQLVKLQRAGLDGLNISLDTLKPEKYEKITRRKGWERVIAGIDLAIQLGYKPKVNCVVMKGFNEDEILDFVEFTRDRAVDIRFIEYMPFAGNKWDTVKLLSFKEMIEIINSRWSNFIPLENGPNDTSKAFKVEGYLGQVGFITSMTQHFCGSCNRLRITADGNLKVCLFGNTEVSLRDAIRNGCSESDVIALISAAVKRKKKQHAAYLKNLSLVLNIPSTFIQSPLLTLSSSATFAHRLHFRQLSCLTHTDSKGKARMVDVSAKNVTKRTAIARARICVGKDVYKLVKENQIKKGDVLTVAQIASVLAAKRTSDLIPLCHNIPLSGIKTEFELNDKDKTIEIIATVNCDGKTGVEMEALMAVSVAALTIYDMCKAVSHEMVIEDIRLIQKTGGKSKYTYSE
ncbi:molybdenum cofactor biosynthesis protein 1 isoform X1 [Culicoides brevitarsis]|uniref:molybdenum cofactor biosynthesis protein 1 isoform X1 n=1 Tax=Culicoides brevitarsis TaxID=469753 RepID=UPI00307B42BE